VIGGAPWAYASATKKPTTNKRKKNLFILTTRSGAR
jgi:hypothetical protein